VNHPTVRRTILSIPPGYGCGGAMMVGHMDGSAATGPPHGSGEADEPSGAFGLGAGETSVHFLALMKW
jgi:hypothetical protein